MDRDDLDSRVSGIAALDQPLRRRLYDLAAREWIGRDDAADALGVPRSVAAFHLDKLADAGLLEVRYERPEGRGGPGAGRPAKQYRRAQQEIAVSVPDRRYDLAAELLAGAADLAASEGRPVVDVLAEVAHDEGVRIGAAARMAAGDTAGRRVLRTAAVAALSRLGYEPRDEGRGVVLANCPFHALVDDHRALICGMNHALVGGIVDGLGDRLRLEARLDPSPADCCVRLAPA